MDENYYRYIREWFGRWAWFYNFIALPLIGVRNKVADLIDEGDKIKILDVCTGMEPGHRHLHLRKGVMKSLGSTCRKRC